MHSIEQGPRKHSLRERLDDEGVVGGVQDSKAQDDVSDQRVVHECLAPGHQAGDSGSDQPGLERLPGRVIAVQHPVLTPGEPGGGLVAEQILQQPVRLGGLVGEHVHGDAMLGVAIGLEPLLEQAGIVGDQLPGGVEDLPGAAAIQVQNDRRVDAEVGPEALQDRGIGTGPGEDRLFVVTHGEAAAVSRGEVGDDLVLRQAQVLELVHQHVVPAAPDVVPAAGCSRSSSPVRAMRSS